MDLVNPDGSKIDIQREAEKAAQEEEMAKSKASTDAPAPAKAEEKVPEDPPKPPLWGEITREGIMKLEINMAVCSQRNELLDQFSGFMDRHKAVGIGQMVAMQQERARLRVAIQKAQQKRGFNGFLSRLRGG